MPKIESTNITIIYNEKIGYFSIKETGREAGFIGIEHLEEVKNLLNDIYEQKSEIQDK